jgi:hypothetical protein
MGMRVQGTTAFQGDLIRSSVVEVDGGFFSQDPFSINMGRGSATLAYRPITFDGELTATKVTFNMQWGGEQGVPAVGGKPIEPMDPQPCRDAETDAPDCVAVEPVEPCDPTIKECEFREELPAVEVFDRTGSGQWVRLPQLEMGATYDLADPGRYVDPGSGTLLVRFVNDVQDGMVFGFQVRIEGEVS